MADAQPIDICMDRWHDLLRGKLDGGLDSLLHDDVTFLSPIVFTPQKGRELTTLYLNAAGGTLGGTDGPISEGPATSSESFHYVKEIRQGHHAMLEFETTIEGKYVNGVDIITCDDEGMITELKVMIRPLQAIDLVHERMKAMLDTLSSA